MDKKEAQSVLTQHLEGWRKRSYQELVGLLGNQGCDEVIGPSGAAYQIEVDVLWDGKSGGPVLVVGSIDDGRLATAFRPLIDSFIMTSDGGFIGEDEPRRSTD